MDIINLSYNKQHNLDTTIPPWIIKHKGTSYYVNHIESKLGFSTKETPLNEHTKGSIKFKGSLKIENDNGNTIAIIS